MSGMTNIPLASRWMGKPLTDYSKEELIKIIDIMGKDLQETRRRYIEERSILFSDRRRGCYLEPKGNHNSNPFIGGK